MQELVDVSHVKRARSHMTDTLSRFIATEEMHGRKEQLGPKKAVQSEQSVDLYAISLRPDMARERTIAPR